MDIPASTLTEIIELRKENGLEATEAAVHADLAKVKWTLQETPRYRKAGRSPIYLPGKLLTAKGTDPVTGEVDALQSKREKVTGGAAPDQSRKNEKASKVEKTQFYRVLHGKGFAVKMTQDILTGELETQVPASIERLGLKFDGIPANAEGIYVTQTSPQIQIAMPLDKFLEIAGLKP